jgi:Tol biopolymer transport system component
MLRSLLLVAALVAFLGFAAQRSSGASHPRDGRIAYDHVGTGSRFQIYTSTATGAHRRPLTAGRRYSSFAPSYSPNGRRIVFVRSFKQSDLWTMGSSGARKRQLTATAGIDETQPAWSPDGEQIAFSVESPTDQRGIWIVGADGRGRRQLTSGADSDPSWSPDGTVIAFERFSGKVTKQWWQIYVVPAAGGTATNLTEDLSVADVEPAWSPDGSRILFSSDRGDATGGANQLDLWSMTPQGTDVRRVTNTPARDEHDPAWSPDGRWIAYSGVGSFHGASSSQLYVSRPDGSSRRKITHACGECAYVNDDAAWQPLSG